MRGAADSDFGVVYDDPGGQVRPQGVGDDQPAGDGQSLPAEGHDRADINRPPRVVPAVGVGRVPAVRDADRQGRRVVPEVDVRDPELAAGDLDLAEPDAPGLDLATV